MIHLSPLYPYMNRMLAQAQKQFGDPTKKLSTNKDGTEGEKDMTSKDLLKNMVTQSLDNSDEEETKADAQKKQAETRSDAAMSTKLDMSDLDLLKSKDHLIGVQIKKQTV